MIRFLRPFDPHRIRLLVFDLDGTLIDSRLDLIHSVNAMLQHIGRSALDGGVIASYVGDGAPALVRRAVGDSAVDILTGRNAGLWTCGVTYGFAPHSLEEVPPDVLIESPRELGELFRASETSADI